MRFDLTDAEWRVIGPLLPPHGLGKARVDDRRVLDAIFYILRTGAPWRDLPSRYGPYTTAYNRFNRWSRKGVWGQVFDALTREMPGSLHAVDSTIVKAHRAAAGATYGPPRLQVVCIRWLEQSAQTYPAFPPRRLAKMEIRVSWSS